MIFSFFIFHSSFFILHSSLFIIHFSFFFIFSLFLQKLKTVMRNKFILFMLALSVVLGAAAQGKVAPPRRAR